MSAIRSFFKLPQLYKHHRIIHKKYNHVRELSNLKVLKHCASVDLDLRNTKITELVITSGWEENATVDYDGNIEIEMQEDNEDSSSSISVPTQCDNLVMRLTVPEYVNLCIHATQLTLTLKNKIQGDFILQCDGGSVHADKLRGSNLQIHCGTADVNVKKLLEGNLNLTANSLSAKMVNGDNISVNVQKSITIEAMYSKYSELEAGEDVKISMFHGYLKAQSLRKSIAVNGLDGSFDLMSARGDIDMSINKLDNSLHDKHALGRMQASKAVAMQGRIYVAVDPEVEASLECRSINASPSPSPSSSSSSSSSSSPSSSPSPSPSEYSSSSTDMTFAIISSDAFEADETLSDLSSTPVADKVDGEGQISPTGKPSSSFTTVQGSHVIGTLTGKSKSVKKPTFNSGASTSGKISLPDAANQSFLTFQQKESNDTNNNTDNTGNPENTGNSENAGFIAQPDMQFLALTGVQVETMSWIQIIRRKYGFLDEDEGTLPPAQRGRTASSSPVPSSKGWKGRSSWKDVE